MGNQNKGHKQTDTPLSDFGDLPDDPISARERDLPLPHAESAESLRLQMYFDRALARATDKMEQNFERRLKESTKEIKSFIKTAFPEEDLDGHKRAHETQMITAKRWNELKARFFEKAFTTGALAAIAFAALAVWESIKSEVKK